MRGWKSVQTGNRNCFNPTSQEEQRDSRKGLFFFLCHQPHLTETLPFFLFLSMAHSDLEYQQD